MKLLGSLIKSDNLENFISDNFVMIEKDSDKMKYDFYIAKFPTTEKDIGEVLGQSYENEKEYLAEVEYQDIMRYCNYLSTQKGLPPAYDVDNGWLIDENGNKTENICDVKGFRLPMPNEWNYAAMGGKPRDGQYFEVQVVLDRYFLDSSYCEKKIERKEKYEIGEFDKNSLGIHEILGNVIELTQNIKNGNIELIVCMWGIYYTNYDCWLTYYVKGEKRGEHDKNNFRLVITKNKGE